MAAVNSDSVSQAITNTDRIRHDLKLSTLRAQNVTSYYVGMIPLLMIDDILHTRILHSYDTKRLTSQWKFVGGEGEISEGTLETVGEAAWREFLEEALRPKSQVSFPLSKAQLISMQDVPDEDNTGGFHRKMFFVISERDLLNYKGDMHWRTSPKPDGLDLLSGTTQIPVVSARQWLRERSAHMKAYFATLRFLANESPDLQRQFPDRLLSEAFSNGN